MKKGMFLKPCVSFTCLYLLLHPAESTGSTQRYSPFFQDTIIVNKTTEARKVSLIYNALPANQTATSTQTLTTAELTRMPVTNVTNALVGRVAGLATTQNSGSLTADLLSLTLRGQTPVIIIDGIVRNLNAFDPSQVESITVLKDALATATLGVRGANGAIVITTKKGSAEKQNITFSARTSLQRSVNVPRVLDAYNYAVLYNEALVNDGRAPLYTDADLQGYKNHTDPYKYPDVDWRKEILENTNFFTQYNLNINGGNRTARYYVSLEHTNQTGLFKTGNVNTYDTDNDFKRYVLRSNVDVNITPTLVGGINLFGSVNTVNYTGALPSQLLNALFNTPNNAYPIKNPNGSFGGNQQYQNNLKAGMDYSGYGQNYFRDIAADFYLKKTLDEVTPGLWVKATGSYYSSLREDINRAKSFAVYQYAKDVNGNDVYTKFGNDGIQANGNSINYQRRYDYFEFAAGYDKVFQQRHALKLLVLGNRDNYVNGADLPYTISGVSGRATYTLDEKYTAEFAVGYNGSNRYPPEGSTRYTLYPAAGLSWNLDKEAFIKRQSWINQLRLFASYGLTGWDNPGYFQYLKRYFDGATNYSGTSATGQFTTVEQPLPNMDRTTEKAAKLNVGLQGAVLNNRLSFTLEYYNNRLYDLLAVRGISPALLGADFPVENIGRQRFQGIDLQLGWQQQFSSGWNYRINVTGGLLKTKLLYTDEVKQPYAWMQRTGEVVGRLYGYEAVGLFHDQAEINQSATIPGYLTKPGDIKYKDLNGDGVINQFDQAAIGTGKPAITYGAVFGVSYKGFELDILLQGMQNRVINLSNNSYQAFQNGGFGQAYAYNLNRWTPENADNASYPRVTLGSNPNNQAFSSYWLRNGNYMRVKNVELAYTLSAAFLQKVKLQSVRLSVGASNLLTFSALEKGVDPEMYNGGYPLQQFFTGGITLKF